MKTICKFRLFRSLRNLGQFREESTAHHNRFNLAGLICTVRLKWIPVGWNRHLRMGCLSSCGQFAESDIGKLRNTCTILVIVDTTAAPALYVLG